MDINKVLNEILEIKKWVDLVKDFISKFNLKSKVKDTKYGSKAIIDKSEKKLIERMLYTVKHSSTSIEYIFEGNVKYKEV